MKHNLAAVLSHFFRNNLINWSEYSYVGSYARPPICFFSSDQFKKLPGRLCSLQYARLFQNNLKVMVTQHNHKFVILNPTLISDGIEWGLQYYDTTRSSQKFVLTQFLEFSKVKVKVQRTNAYIIS